MEGLIPLVYKSLKKSQTRRKYECLSSGEAAQPYNIADFYVKDDGRDRDEYMGRRGYATPDPDDTQSGRHGAHHRRCSSVVIDGPAPEVSRHRRAAVVLLLLRSKL